MRCGALGHSRTLTKAMPASAPSPEGLRRREPLDLICLPRERRSDEIRPPSNERARRTRRERLEAERRRVEELGRFLSQFHWQAFATPTFKNEVSFEQAQRQIEHRRDCAYPATLLRVGATFQTGLRTRLL